MSELTARDSMKVARQLDASSDFHRYHFRLLLDSKKTYSCVWFAIIYACSYVTYFSQCACAHACWIRIITALRKYNYSIEEA